jgi:hypothetical protein
MSSKIYLTKDSIDRSCITSDGQRGFYTHSDGVLWVAFTDCCPMIWDGEHVIVSDLPCIEYVAPDVPDVPAVPVAPDVPDVPAVPVAPDVPDVPAVPVAPVAPTVPTVPTVDYCIGSWDTRCDCHTCRFTMPSISDSSTSDDDDDGICDGRGDSCHYTGSCRYCGDRICTFGLSVEDSLCLDCDDGFYSIDRPKCLKVIVPSCEAGTCGDGGPCGDCGTLCCFWRIYGDDRICEDCEALQFAADERDEAVYRP